MVFSGTLTAVIFTIAIMFGFIPNIVLGVVSVLGIIVWSCFIIFMFITSGYGGFPYWNLLYTNKKTDVNTVSEAEEEKLKKFLSAGDLQVGDTYDC